MPWFSSLLITRCTTNLNCAWRGLRIPILTTLDWKFLLVVCTWLRTICHLYSVMFESCMQNLVSILDLYHIMMKLQSHPLQNADTMSIIQCMFIHFYFWIEGGYSYIDAKYSTLSFTRKSLEWPMSQCWDARNNFFLVVISMGLLIWNDGSCSMISISHCIAHSDAWL